MALYDTFAKSMDVLPPYVRRAEGWRQRRILDWLDKEGCLDKAPAVLEIGVGCGMMAEACRQRGWRYVGVDRNENLVSRLSPDYFVAYGTCPPLPDQVKNQLYEVTYSAFVLEHLSDGEVALKFVEEMASVTAKGGIVALLTPDVASLGMEFWNMDYTHKFPTSWRNVAQIIEEAGLSRLRVIRYRGPGFTGWVRWLIICIGWIYSYRIFGALTKRRSWAYSVYQYVCQDILCFMAHKDNG